jgi:hypothetical protein
MTTVATPAETRAPTALKWLIGLHAFGAVSCVVLAAVMLLYPPDHRLPAPYRSSLYSGLAAFMFGLALLGGVTAYLLWLRRRSGLILAIGLAVLGIAFGLFARSGSVATSVVMLVLACQKSVRDAVH